KPFIRSVKPKVRRNWPVTISSPTVARMNPIRIETKDLRGFPPPSPTKLEKVSNWMAKNSGGPNFRAISASNGAKRVISTMEKNAPIKEEEKAAVKACPPCPCRAIGKPSNVVATDQGSPGMLNKIDVMAPPKSAPQ